MNPNDFRDEWRKRLRGQSYPLLATRGSDGLHILSGAALWNRSIEMIRSWRRAGARPGDLLIDSPEGIAGATRIVAALLGGFLYYPMPPEEFTTGANTAVKGRGARRAFCLLSAPSNELREVAMPAAISSLEPLQPNARLVLGTSGTSGSGRLIVVLDAECVRHQLICHAEALDLEEGASRLSVLPWWHSFGLVLDLLLGLWAGQAIWIQPDLSLRSHSLVKVCREDHINHLAVVPRLAAVLFAGLRDGPGLPELCLHTGGARVTDSLRQAAAQRVGRWVDGYGLTECGPGVLLDGIPIGCEVCIEDGSGELLVRSEHIGLFDGRKDRLDGSGRLRTRDIGEQDSPGRFAVLGRIGNAWKDASGHWVTTRDIEAWADRKCAGEVVGISHDGAHGLRVAIALPERTPALALDWVGSLENAFHKRFGVPMTLRTCVLTPEYRDLLHSARAKSMGDALVKSMFPSREGLPVDPLLALG